MSLKHKHNLDSQVANRICEKINWVIPLHDAFTIHPNDGYDVRKIYTTCMHNIYTNRKEILKKYFKSIGINEEYKEMVHDNVIKEFSPYCLK